MMEEAVGDGYDVFLSFRGDIRSGFVSVLYDYLDRAGIRVFRDSDEIGPGSRIEGIFKAIEKSVICIPIFSKNYASSKWCLQEVTKMVEVDGKIIPIYYDVKVDDVMLRTELYNLAIRKHHHSRDTEKVERWKKAMGTVATLKGMSVGTSRSYIDFCKSFTTTVVGILKATKGYEKAAVEDYDMFLSFRGHDVGQGFFSVLYDYLNRAGYRVFKDEDDRRYGDKYDSIVKVIKNSKMCVTIFSRKYPYSTRCLTEVRMMVELNKHIIPIFYNVSPDDVKLKTELYSSVLNKHFKKHGTEEVHRWAAALKTVSRLRGFEVLNGSVVMFCKKFTTVVSSMLKPRKRYDAEGLVGMNRAVDSAMALLNIDSLDVRYIGITGMGGIGKTTLAKFIFDHLSTSFENSAFIEDIRESSRRHGGLDYLEQQLRERLDPKLIINSNMSRNIKERFHRRKVLIVLDDVDNQEQIEKLARDPTWFGKGSRIIITSRNIKDVLTDYYRVDNYSKSTMEMETLELDEALQLFRIYAFGSNNPPTPAFQHLSNEVVSNAGGLPLTLTVFGSRLRNKEEGVWEEVIARSKEVPPKEVMERLRISYDALESYVQQVFLDIACFFIGEEMTNPSYMWTACKLSPLMSLATLNSMSLVKTTKDNKIIWMHDQLRDLGRYIVSEQSSHLTERTRLWIQKEAMSVLMSKEALACYESSQAIIPNHKKDVGSCVYLLICFVRQTFTSSQNKKNVRAIRLAEPCKPFKWNETHFSSLENLRYLQLKGANFLMNFEGLLPNLIWLSWHSFPEEIGDMKFPLTSLVVLDLSESFIDENWGGWRQIQAAKELKVLDLTSCQNLTTTPEFSEHMPLERLILKACKKLVSLHTSIISLKKLKHLNLEECCLLRELPNGIRSIDDTLTEMPISGSGLNLSMS